MKIKTLDLINFQGISSAHINFGADTTNIYGDNATGKTTVYNALTWLLLDCASTGAKGFTPKTKTADGDAHYLDHAASATFVLDSGRPLTLKKVFHETYKKKRGSATEEFTGHTTDYYIDGVPNKEADYYSMLDELGGVERLKLLIMPDYFADRLPWDERRKILLDVCGDVSDDDVIDSDPELAGLRHYLAIPNAPDEQYTVEDYRKIATARKKEINDKLKTIPARIDEATRAISNTDIADDIDDQLRAAEEIRAELEKRRLRLSDAETARIEAHRQTELARLEYERAKTAYQQRCAGEQAAINEQRAQQMQIVQKLKDKFEDMLRTEGRLEMSATELEKRRTVLIDEYNAVAAEKWDADNAICPTCHRPLPPEEVEQMKSDFNLRKSRRLEEINQRGKQEADKEKIAALRAEAEQIRSELPAKKWELDEQTKKLEAMPLGADPTPFDVTDEAYALLGKIKELKEAEESAAGTVDDRLTEIDHALEENRQKVGELNRQKALKVQVANQQQRIEELSAEEKQLSAEFEDLEHGIYLCELFTRKKVAALNERINASFTTVRFQLFAEQVNGGVKETCEVLIPDATGRLVPYAFANNAARINAGLEIIKVLGRHYGLTAPVVVDNAESVTALNGDGLQLIRLIVSEQDKILRVEN